MVATDLQVSEARHRAARLPKSARGYSRQSRGALLGEPPEEVLHRADGAPESKHLESELRGEAGRQLANPLAFVSKLHRHMLDNGVFRT